MAGGDGGGGSNQQLHHVKLLTAALMQTKKSRPLRFFSETMTQLLSHLQTLLEQSYPEITLKKERKQPQ